MMPRKFAILLAAFLQASALHASEDPAALAAHAVERLDAAQVALGAAARAKDRVAALSLTVRAYEDGLNALRASLRQVALRQSEIAQKLNAESAQISRMLGVMMRVQSSAGPLVQLHPEGPIDTLRAGLIAAEMTPALRADADALRTDLQTLADLQAVQKTAAQQLQRALSEVQTARTELSEAMASRADLPRRFLSDPVQLQALVDSARTLDAFANALPEMATGAGINPIRDFQSAKGTLALPVSGTLLRGFQQPDAAGIVRPGIVVMTRPKSLVTAPWDVTLRYKGALLDYGNVMILEPSAGVLIVLAGLDRVYGEVGQVLGRNTALGLMGGLSDDPDRFFADAVAGAGSQASETLYIELRLGGTPVDPANWFAETKE